MLAVRAGMPLLRTVRRRGSRRGWGVAVALRPGADLAATTGAAAAQHPELRYPRIRRVHFNLEVNALLGEQRDSRARALLQRAARDAWRTLGCEAVGEL